MCVNNYDVRLTDTHPACGMNWPPDLTDLHPYLSVRSEMPPFSPGESARHPDSLAGSKARRRQVFVSRDEACGAMDRV